MDFQYLRSNVTWDLDKDSKNINKIVAEIKFLQMVKEYSWLGMLCNENIQSELQVSPLIEKVYIYKNMDRICSLRGKGLYIKGGILIQRSYLKDRKRWSEYST